MESVPYTHLPASSQSDPCNYEGSYFSSFSYFSMYSVIDKNARLLENIIVPSIFGIITIVGLFGNLTIIFVTLRSRSMRGVTNFFIMNNAVSDIIFLLLCVPITATQFWLDDWMFGGVVCKFFAYIQHAFVIPYLSIILIPIVFQPQWINAYFSDSILSRLVSTVAVQASCATLVAMTLDRYKVIVRPMESLTSRTVTRTTMTNLTIWIVSLLLHLPSLIFFKVNEIPGNGCDEVIRYCGVEDLANTYFVSYEIISKFVMYIIPFIIMSYCYLRIVRSVWNKYQLASLHNAYNDTRRRQKVKVTQMTVLVVLLFGICWGPLHVIHLVGYISGGDIPKLSHQFHTFCLCLAYSNAALNPFVYALTGRYYREILEEACRSKRVSKKRNSAMPPTSTTRAGVRRQSLDIPFDPKLLEVRRTSNDLSNRKLSESPPDPPTSSLLPSSRSNIHDGSPLTVKHEVDQDIINHRAEILRRKYSLDDDFV